MYYSIKRKKKRKLSENIFNETENQRLHIIIICIIIAKSNYILQHIRYHSEMKGNFIKMVIVVCLFLYYFFYNTYISYMFRPKRLL